MTILVTGASGFIGRALCRRLKGRGHDVLPLTSAAQDITFPFKIHQPIDVLIHLAAYNITNVGLKDTDLYARVNVQGTKHVLDAVQSKQMIFCSTAKVYRNEGRPLNEESPVAPAGAYEQSKWQGEELCRKLFKGEILTILRLANVLGLGQAPKAVLPMFAARARAGQPLQLLANAQTAIQYIALNDVLDVIELCLGNAKAQGVFNAAHDQCVTLRQMAEMVIDSCHSSSVIEERGGDVPAAYAPIDCRKAKQVLGWSPQTDLKSVLEHYCHE